MGMREDASRAWHTVGTHNTNALHFREIQGTLNSSMSTLKYSMSPATIPVTVPLQQLPLELRGLLVLSASWESPYEHPQRNLVLFLPHHSNSTSSNSQRQHRNNHVNRNTYHVHKALKSESSLTQNPTGWTSPLSTCRGWRWHLPNNMKHVRTILISLLKTSQTFNHVILWIILFPQKCAGSGNPSPLEIGIEWHPATMSGPQMLTHQW